MSYTITLKRGTLALLLAGLGGVGTLLFTAGLAVGVDAGARRTLAAAPPAEPLPTDTAPAQAAPVAASGTADELPAEHTPERPVGHTGGPGEEEGAFSLQVGELRGEDRALALLARLEAQGYAPFLVSGVDARGRVFFHVRLEEYGSREAAREAAVRFTRREGFPAWVVPSEYALP